MTVMLHMLAEVLADFVNDCGRVDLRRGIEAKDLGSAAAIFQRVLEKRGLALAIPHDKKPTAPARDIDRLDRFADQLDRIEKHLGVMSSALRARPERCGFCLGFLGDGELHRGQLNKHGEEITQCTVGSARNREL